VRYLIGSSGIWRRLSARVYDALKAVIEKRIPLVVTCAGPITVSDQHARGSFPFKGGEHGIYHGNRCDLLPRWARLPAQDGGTSDTRGGAVWRRRRVARERHHPRDRYGFEEQVLFDQDAVVTEILQRPEFQKRMTTTERNYLLGKHYGERERALGIAPA